jgi:hypothetical protein
VNIVVAPQIRMAASIHLLISVINNNILVKRISGYSTIADIVALERHYYEDTPA